MLIVLCAVATAALEFAPGPVLAMVARWTRRCDGTMRRISKDE